VADGAVVRRIVGDRDHRYPRRPGQGRVEALAGGWGRGRTIPKARHATWTFEIVEPVSSQRPDGRGGGRGAAGGRLLVE